MQLNESIERLSTYPTYSKLTEISANFQPLLLLQPLVQFETWNLCMIDIRFAIVDLSTAFFLYPKSVVFNLGDTAH